MGTPIPKAKVNPSLPPELKRTLVQAPHTNATAASVASGSDVATLLTSLQATVTSLNNLITNYNSLLAKLRAAGILDS